MYQLLINGAIAEHNTQQYESAVPDFVRTQLQDKYLEQAAEEAWRGTAYTPHRFNILGSISFMVVLLFFFESCCRIRLNDYDSHFQDMLRELRNKSDIDADTFEALKYLAEFRNVWHNFGIYRAGKPQKPKCSYNPANCKLTFPDLIPDQLVAPSNEPQAVHLLDKVLTPFCSLTDLK